MRTLTVTARPHTEELLGHELDRHHYDVLIADDTRVVRPDGSLLLVYERHALSPAVCAAALKALRDVPVSSDNRGTASGQPLVPRRLRDGTWSRTLQSPRSAPSGILGFFGRSPRFPYCRLTALTRKYPREYEAACPLFVAASRQFAQLVPDRFAAQQAFIDIVHEDFFIGGTVFTTVTLNKSFRTRAHRDAGDYSLGFGVLAVLEDGQFSGSELIFPKYRVAVDLRTRGLLCADVHEIHANAPLVVQPPSQRLSLVMYARERMDDCRSAEEEAQE